MPLLKWEQRPTLVQGATRPSKPGKAVISSRRKFLQFAAGAAAASPLLGFAAPSAYPAGPLAIVVGFPAGGPVDIAARMAAPWLSHRLGQPVAVENRPGQSGNTATAAVVNAVPDGRTLLMCGPVHAINTILFPDLPFVFTRDIVPVAGVCRVPLVVEVNPTVPARTIPELIALAKSRPGKLRVAHAGRGTPQQVGIELFRTMAGVDITLVPYLGSAPALEDLLAGRADVMFDPVPSSMQHIREGRLVPLGVTGTSRLEALPDVPVVSDFVAGYESGSWFGLGAPRGTPAQAIGILNAAVNDGLREAATAPRLVALGATAMPGSPADFAAFIGREAKKYAAIIRAERIPAG